MADTRIQIRTGLRWRDGEDSLRRLVDGWFAGDASVDARTLAESARRRIVCVGDEQGGELVIKHFKPLRGIRRTREALKAALRRAPDDREWQALTKLAELGFPCPKPLARATAPGGSRLVVESFAAGRPLEVCLRDPKAQRWPLLRELGELVGRLHAAGVVHRDLHVGNLISGGSGPVLLDLQRARFSSRRACQLEDLGSLDFSLAHAGLSLGDRIRFREAALEYGGSGWSRDDMQCLATASARRGQQFYRSRTRRCGRSGRRYARVRTAEGAGLRVRSFSAAAVDAVVAAHRKIAPAAGPTVVAPIGRAVPAQGSILLKRDHRALISAVEVDGRSVVVKEVIKGGVLRHFADLVRGSPARRSWFGGHGLRIRGIDAAEPLAYLEQRIAGIPTRSLLICQDLRDALPLSELNFIAVDSKRALPFEGEELMAALSLLARRLHRLGIRHGDLQSLHIYARRGQSGIETTLIDLDGVAFQGELSETARWEDLAALNASLHDQVANPEQRLRAFRDYARALPFEGGAEAALQQVVTRSVERRHAWKGDGCRFTPAR